MSGLGVQPGDVSLGDDDFTLFGLPQRFAQDAAAIDARWRAWQAQVHPDRHAAAGAAAQRVAMQWATRINEAHRRLKDPLARATLLCTLRGTAVDAERHTAMPPQFLMQQMQWRETLAEGGDAAALASEVQHERAQLMAQLEQQLDTAGDAAAAAQTVRALLFVRRFAAELDARLHRA